MRVDRTLEHGYLLTLASREGELGSLEPGKLADGQVAHERMGVGG